MKNRGQLRITKELVHKMFGFPEFVRIEGITLDPVRDIVHVVIGSEEPREGYTFPTQEAAIPQDMYDTSVQACITQAEWETYKKVRNALAGVKEGEGVPLDPEDTES